MVHDRQSDERRDDSSTQRYTAHFTVSSFWSSQAAEGYLILSDSSGSRFLVVGPDGVVIGDVFDTGLDALEFAQRDSELRSGLSPF